MFERYVLIAEQPQRSRSGHGFGPSLNLQFAKYCPVISLDGTQRKNELIADFTVREALSNEFEDLLLASGQRFDQRLG